MDPNDVWLAGLFEGEGTLSLQKNNGWTLCICMCDEDVVRRAHDVGQVGSVTMRPPGGPRRQPQWAWRVHGRLAIADIVERILPQLGQRRRAKAEEFLAWHRSGAPAPTTPEHRAKMAARVRARRAAARIGG